MSVTEHRNYHFETLQLHVGQETADPATDARPFPSIKPRLMFSIAVITPPPGSVWQMPEISMDG